ncbi:MAG: hypothetical protein M0Q51_15730 [Bacteroidales bacterium]|nr:hypothetical protein [Bacteroidales bacterium]
MKNLVPIIIIAIFFTMLNSCKEKDNDPGNIRLTFEEKVDGELLQTDTLKYVNEAGNPYMINEVQYFISKFTLYFNDGEFYTVKDNMGMHYIDSDIPGTKSWDIPEDIPSGRVDSIVFVFGLDEADNQSNIFPNPPESNMFWPEELGGGYHYMKLNGKYQDTTGLLAPFNFHLGIGQTYDTTGQVTGFVQNYFKVSFPLIMMSSLLVDVKPGQTTELILTMNIDSWFATPHTWDFNYWGGMMMQNQAALQAACENGRDAFSIGAMYEL